jgi:lysophospholipid acyltransferase (LPLAT)-like uncharacterized protein
MGSIRFRVGFLKENVDPYAAEPDRPFIYAIWHENLLVPVYYYRRSGMRYMISQHADGQVLAEIGRRLGVPLVRGSSTRGGIEALREVLRGGREAHLALTPDGPRGPRRRVQAGVVYMAARTGMSIVPAGFGYTRLWRLNSWDQMALPHPWSFVAAVTAEPVIVPASIGRHEIEEYRTLVETRLAQATHLAEAWADSGEKPAGLIGGDRPRIKQRHVSRFSSPAA